MDARGDSDLPPPPRPPLGGGRASDAALGVHRLVVNLGGQKPEQVAQRLPEIEALVKKAA